MKALEHFKKKPLDLLALALPLALLAEVAHWEPIWTFALSALGIIPLADYIGEATEALASYTSPKVGGLLNATLGNAAELIITIIAIREGLLDLVLASITGSIIGNLLLVMGLSMLVGGLRHGLQQFDRRHASNNAVSLLIAVSALSVPSLLSSSIGPDTSPKVETFSLGVATVMIALYVLSLTYSLRRRGPFSTDERVPHQPAWSFRRAVAILSLSTLGVVLFSELLVSGVDDVVLHLGVSEFFIGIILVPVVGNVAEHLCAVKMAAENKMDLSVEIAVASSLQIALFVAPALVFVSLVMGNPLHLVFNQFELLALGLVALITWTVSADGECNWLEGAILLGLYSILGLAFFLLPG